MESFSTILPLVMASVLLWAGLEKIREPSRTASTIRALGASWAVARVAARLLACAELSLAIGLLFRPGSHWTQLAVVALGLGFAGAAVRALVRGERIRCHCFGAGGGGYLGAAQLWALIPWVGGAALLRVISTSPRPMALGAASLLSAALLITLLRGVVVLQAWRNARGDRRTAREMFAWMH